VRFLLTRRWLLFGLTVVLLAWGAWALGQWQFHRLDEKRAANHRIQHNLAAVPVPIGELLGVHRPATTAVEWRRVTVTGTWDDRHSVVVKYQTNAQGVPGVHVATPLVTRSGAAVLVDRGWMQTENVGSTRPRLPRVTPGEVTVTGWVRVDASGSATQVADLSTRALSSRSVADVVPYPLYRGFLDLDTQSPPPVKGLGATEMPDDTGDGPHFFYGLQWWFFGLLALTGFLYLAYDEWRRAHVGGVAPEAPSQGAEHAAVDREHHAGHKA
jgi:cytochrome oxidase assembly protein ShyY1